LTRKQNLPRLPTGGVQIRVERLARLLGQFEPHRPTGAAVSCAPLSPRPPAGAAVCALAGMVAAKNETPIDVKEIAVVEVMT
jgi:hypothetical protein